MLFPERIVKLKKDRGVLQKDIAQALGMSVRGYQRYEHGEREPTASTLITLADFFGVSVDYLLGRTDNPKINR